MTYKGTHSVPMGPFPFSHALFFISLNLPITLTGSDSPVACLSQKSEVSQHYRSTWLRHGRRLSRTARPGCQDA